MAAEEGGIVIPVRLPGGQENVVTLEALAAAVLKLADASKKGEEGTTKFSDSFEKGFIRRAGEEVFVKLKDAILDIPESMGRAIEATIAAGDRLSTLAQRTNWATDQLQGLDVSARASNLSVETLARVSGNLSNQLAASPEKLQRLGIVIEDFVKLDAGQQFAEVAEKIKAIENPAAQASMAVALFGNRLGRQVLPLIKEGMGDATAEAIRLGQVMGKEDVKAMSDIERASLQYDATVKGLKQNVALFVIDQLHLEQGYKKATEAVGVLSNAMKGMREWYSGLPEGVRGVVEALAGWVGITAAVVVGITAFLAAAAYLGPTLAAIGAAALTAAPAVIAIGAAVAGIAAAFALGYKAGEKLREWFPSFAKEVDAAAQSLYNFIMMGGKSNAQLENQFNAADLVKIHQAAADAARLAARPENVAANQSADAARAAATAERERLANVALYGSEIQKSLGVQRDLNTAIAAGGTAEQQAATAAANARSALKDEVQYAVDKLTLEKQGLAEGDAKRKEIEQRIALEKQYGQDRLKVLNAEAANRAQDLSVEQGKKALAIEDQRFKIAESIRAAQASSLVDYERIAESERAATAAAEETYKQKLATINLEQKGGKISGKEAEAQKGVAEAQRAASVQIAGINAANAARDLGLRLQNQQIDGERQMADMVDQLAQEQEQGLSTQQKADAERDRALASASREYDQQLAKVQAQLAAGKSVSLEEFHALGLAQQRRDMAQRIAEAIRAQKAALLDAAKVEATMKATVADYLTRKKEEQTAQTALNALKAEAAANDGMITLATGETVKLTDRLARELFPEVVGQSAKWYDSVAMIGGMLSGIGGVAGKLIGTLTSGLGQVASMASSIGDKIAGFADPSKFKGLGGGLKAMFADTKGGFSFSSILQGAGMAGQMASAALGVVNMVKGLFSKPEYKKVMADVGKSWGVEISEGLAKQIEATETKDKVNRQMAELLNISAIIEESGKDAATFKDKIGDLMNAIKLGAVPAKEGVKALGGAFSELEKSATEAGRSIDATIIQTIQRTKQLGIEMPAEMKQYIEAAHELAAQGAKEIAEGMAAQFTSKTGGDDWAVAGKDAALFFGYGFQKTMEDKGIVAALDEMGDQLKDFYQKLKDSGDTEGMKILAPWEHLRHALDDSTEGGKQLRGTLETLGGMDKVFQGMAKAGDLTVGGFEAMERSIQGTANALSEGGIKGKDAMTAIYGPLKDVVAASQAYGFQLDADTQKLVDQAKAAGFAFPIDPAQAMLDVMVSIAKVLGADIPESAKRAGQAIQQAAAGVGDVAGAAAGVGGAPSGPGGGPPGGAVHAAHGFGPETLKKDTVIYAHAGEDVMVVPSGASAMASGFAGKVASVEEVKAQGAAQIVHAARGRGAASLSGRAGELAGSDYERLPKAVEEHLKKGGEQLSESLKKGSEHLSETLAGHLKKSGELLSDNLRVALGKDGKGSADAAKDRAAAKAAGTSIGAMHVTTGEIKVIGVEKSKEQIAAEVKDAVQRNVAGIRDEILKVMKGQLYG